MPWRSAVRTDRRSLRGTQHRCWTRCTWGCRSRSAAGASVAPTGFAPDGRRSWAQWRDRHCTAGAPAGLTWWHDQRGWELSHLLELLLPRCAAPDRRFSTRFVLSSAVQAAGEGFVQQRIITAAAALENVAWTNVHPSGHENVLYQKYPGVIEECWLMTMHYLVLLTLDSIGYHGGYQSQLRPHSYEAAVKPVPWTSAASGGT